MVFPEQCASDHCSECRHLECKLCKSCMSNSLRHILEEAFREHTRRHLCRRVIPPTLVRTVYRMFMIKQTIIRPSGAITNYLVPLLFFISCLKRNRMEWMSAALPKSTSWCIVGSTASACWTSLGADVWLTALIRFRMTVILVFFLVFFFNFVWQRSLFVILPTKYRRNFNDLLELWYKMYFR